MFSTVSDSVKHMQLFTDSSMKLGLGNGTDDSVDILTTEFLGEAPSGGSGDDQQKCSATVDIGSTDNEWHVENSKESTSSKVRLYVLNKNGEKWYLRAHFLGRRVTFACEDYVNSISDVRQQNLLLM